MPAAAFPAEDAAASAFVVLLQSAHGLAAGEAAAFARYVHALQLFMAGRVRVTDLPRDVVLRHSAPARGVTRWVFGNVAGGTAAAAAAPNLVDEPLHEPHAHAPKA